MEINLKEFLEQFKGVNISYVPNPGNGGDALIAAATFQLFDDLGLQYNCVNRNLSSYDGQTLVYGGGGNLGLMKNFSARLLTRVHRGVKRLVILPHTIKEVTPLLADFGSNVDIICREKISYEYVKNSTVSANVYLANDVALSLNVKQLLGTSHNFLDKTTVGVEYFFNKVGLMKGQAPSLSAARHLFMAEKLLENMRKTASGNTLNAFRTDSEKTGVLLPEDNIDVSEVLTLGVETRKLAYLAAYYFLTFLNDYSVINTNRLHVCIGGALLGKKINFYPNNYFKCRAVYNYSLANNPLVTLRQ
ncbi:polysaccharide pyruvyl transferase family protein [Rhodoferax sp. U2-2l]|uniref:polysaccharide pyruvyl transferase family protein n=1 Tax=Rhodoferax sp. U2-2l TaxID=2884000 RepID=UPI001D09C622|nr:polysaccharide pyruvyl transferase family protein [Rhodoferax sp. U2-2l]MCB8747175.1 polysaccharide pyruvyl transferase family protein [Rhodoferax sp. U2-2l]